MLGKGPFLRSLLGAAFSLPRGSFSWVQRGCAFLNCRIHDFPNLRIHISNSLHLQVCFFLKTIKLKFGRGLFPTVCPMFDPKKSLRASLGLARARRHSSSSLRMSRPLAELRLATEAVASAPGGNFLFQGADVSSWFFWVFLDFCWNLDLNSWIFVCFLFFLIFVVTKYWFCC